MDFVARKSTVFGRKSTKKHEKSGKKPMLLRLGARCRRFAYLQVSRSEAQLPCHSDQKMTVILIQNCSHFFIQTAGLVYHHRTKCGGYHQPLWGWISSRHSRAYPFLRFDDIQCSALMIYRNKLRMIYTFCESDWSFEPLCVFNRKIYIVHFIPLSFNLWGIVQFLIHLIKILVWIIRCSFLNRYSSNNHFQNY